MQINSYFQEKKRTVRKKQPRLFKMRGIFFILFGIIGIWAGIYFPAIMCVIVGVYFFYTGLTLKEEEEVNTETPNEKEIKKKLRTSFEKEMAELDAEFDIPDDEDAEESE